MHTTTPNGLPKAIPLTLEERLPVEPPEPHLAVFSYENPADLLFPDPDERDRTTREYAEYRDLVLRPDIRRRGVQVPLLAYLEGEQKRVFDGGSRLEASILERIAQVPVLTYPKPPSLREKRIGTFLANENRLDWTPAERGRFYLQTLRDEGWSQAEMCRQIPGLRPPAVCKTLKWLDNLPAQFHDKVGDGEHLIPERGAYEICDFPEDQRVELCQKFIDGLLNLDQLNVKRKALKGERKSIPKPGKVKTDGALVQFPGDWTWERFIEFVKRLMEAGKRGLTMPDLLPAAVVPSWLK